MLRAFQTCLLLASVFAFGCQKQQVEEIEAKTEAAAGPTMSQEEKDALMGGEQKHLEKVKEEEGKTGASKTKK